jgi:hypothetical protein
LALAVGVGGCGSGNRRAVAEAEGAVRSYLAALSGRDGATVCSLLTPEAVGELRLPVHRGSCARSVRASIGRVEAPEGRRFRSVKLQRLRTVVQGGGARVTATVVEHYGRGRRTEVSVEDDVIYLSPTGGRWRLAKPSLILYRAVGRGDVGLGTLRPPDGWPPAG